MSVSKVRKAVFRLVTGDQYEYMEVQAEGTAAALKDEFDEFKRLLKVGVGLEDKEWRDALDEILATGKLKNGVELWETMNENQKFILQEIKRSINRRNYKDKE